MLATIALFATPARAQTPPNDSTNIPARPKIGLVLSGGGARGAAHIGVIKVLEELRIPIHYVAGSSMGALVGAAYAAGTSARELEERLVGQDWDRLLTDESPRSDKSFQRKEDDQNRLLRLELGVKDGTVRLPPGAITGQKLDSLFSQITRNAPASQLFDDLPVPFRAVATDAESGRMVVFDRGLLPDAMRASMSVPGAIAPYQIGDRIFLDGGLTRNLPVDVVRQMGADVVIVVNIGTPLLKKQDIQSLVGVSLQMVNILTEQNVRTSLDSMKSTDHLISPPLDTIGAADFSLVGDAITIGAATTRGMAGKLSVLSLPQSEYDALRNAQLAKAPKPPGDRERIDAVRVAGLERSNADELKRTLGIKPGDPIDFKKLNRGVSRVFGSGYYERVNYNLLNDDGFNVLAIDAKEKQWGPNYLRFGISLAADTVGEGRFNLLMRYLLTQFNSAGAEWRNDFQLGRDRRVASYFFQPFGASGLANAFSITPGVEYSRRPVDFFTGIRRDTQFQLSTNATSLDLGFDFSRNAIMRLGVMQSSNTAELNVGISIFPERRFKEGGARFKFVYDDVDDPNFPREGRKFELDYYASLESLKATSEYRRGEVNYLDNYSIGNNTLSFAARYGQSYDGILSQFNRYSLGGFLQLSGYAPGELFGGNIALARLTYYRRLAQLNNPFGKNLYVGLSTEYGKVSDTREQLMKSETRNSIGLFVGFDTLFGPLYVGYGRARQRSPIFYLFLGQP
ncbi:MAG: patatin-like phospholipase family protein [Betaproteobacteria bacterium]|nr:patatin-like phospholipase family protein [Betaproteobacteria bacterium]